MTTLKIEDLCELTNMTRQTLTTHAHILIASLLDNPHAYLDAPKHIKHRTISFIERWKPSGENDEKT